MGNTPKVQTDADVPTEGVSVAVNSEGRTPHGTPEDLGGREPAATPTNDRLATETAALNTEQGKPQMPKR